ncbi:unnamed protein product [Oppiella nova]|uniref:GAIN-B domain-containing protein n=1 Tax=Oppiella nova TaxID=334625 RepID=A0A7R9LT61_9ACAR|nr:unnamed protein product [Oppiella nova]CAG2166135.1 unnamed protein product [Oppiella nova]
MISNSSQYEGRDDEMYSCNRLVLGDRVECVFWDFDHKKWSSDGCHNRLVLGDRVECVFWDFDHKKWSSDGCHVIESESNREITVCECNHLTNFAALMDNSGREDNRMDRKECLEVCEVMSICWISSQKHPNNIYWHFVAIIRVIYPPLDYISSNGVFLVIYQMKIRLKPYKQVN